jgi:hypothetical protein
MILRFPNCKYPAIIAIHHYCINNLPSNGNNDTYSSAELETGLDASLALQVVHGIFFPLWIFEKSYTTLYSTANI